MRMSSSFGHAVVVLLVTACSTAGVHDGRPSPDSAAREFTAAIDHQDIDRLEAVLASDVTMFYPFLALRSDDREAVVKVFRGPFERRRAASAGPRYLNLEPVDFRTQRLGRDAAVVTYHLDRGELMGRRTAVVQWNGNRWQVVSFHASQLKK